ncbi:MAG: transglycosylase SLT domain-containing protein [archaeon]
MANQQMTNKIIALILALLVICCMVVVAMNKDKIFSFFDQFGFFGNRTSSNVGGGSGGGSGGGGASVPGVIQPNYIIKKYPRGEVRIADDSDYKKFEKDGIEHEFSGKKFTFRYYKSAAGKWQYKVDYATDQSKGRIANLAVSAANFIMGVADPVRGGDVGDEMLIIELNNAKENWQKEGYSFASALKGRDVIDGLVLFSELKGFDDSKLPNIKIIPNQGLVEVGEIASYPNIVSKNMRYKILYQGADQTVYLSYNPELEGENLVRDKKATIYDSNNNQIGIINNYEIDMTANGYEYLDNTFIVGNKIYAVSSGVIAKVVQKVQVSGVKNYLGARKTCMEDYSAWIEKYSLEYQIDPVLVLALAIQESDCLQGKVTSSYGVMQIEQGTYNQYCKDIASFSEIQSNAEKNIRCSAKILRNYYNLYGAYGKESYYQSKVRVYCKDAKYLNTFLSYTGWDAALRAYNGLSCSVGNPIYVEELNSVYNNLRTL